ncbi:hypothetical protein [Pseudodesulfovibrio sp. zrk46]|uniref:hypothetical protein n=1 Tax=Pseudodesulfovibrio sp. zrk46 TaxID=2725288 RepID=UPI0014497318|nr:hypothetical protein [Pseudodesulfovibrio sp. zrk46]QJB58037.1 hypothetical protein HFN16_17340 [Pseudodesulfovibrio sp. zrk46]
MYKYYCKDTNCPGHTKSWERCCDLRAFAASTSPKATMTRPTIDTGRSTVYRSTNKQIVA